MEQTTKASTKFATKVSSAPLKMSQIQCGAGKLRQPVASGLLTPWKKGEPASGHRDNKRSVRIIYCREVSAQGFSGLAESTFSGSGVLSLERLRFVAHAFQRAARVKTPKTKLQTPEKCQIISSKAATSRAEFGFGAWDFFGVSSLVFGALIPPDRSSVRSRREADCPSSAVLRRVESPRSCRFRLRRATATAAAGKTAARSNRR